LESSGQKKTQNETFELLNIESRNSQCRKVFGGLLFYPNLGSSEKNLLKLPNRNFSTA